MIDAWTRAIETVSHLILKLIAIEPTVYSVGSTCDERDADSRIVRWYDPVTDID